MLLNLLKVMGEGVERLNISIQKTSGGRYSIVLTGMANSNDSQLNSLLQNNLYLEGTITELEDDLTNHLTQYNKALSNALISNAASSINKLNNSAAKAQSSQKTDSENEPQDTSSADVDAEVSADVNDIVEGWE
jgi:hypothetical protein